VADIDIGVDLDIQRLESIYGDILWALDLRQQAEEVGKR
jgi:hypothetical protein